MPMIMAVTDTTHYVVVPLVAAGIAAAIAATGIAVPIIAVRRQELAKAQIQAAVADQTALNQQIERLRNTVVLLREVLQRFGLEQTLTSAQQQVVESARDRMFQMLYSDQRLFDAIVPSDLNTPHRLQKLMLTLGELESRLGDPFTPAMARDPVTLFGLYTLCYFLEIDPQQKTDDFEVLKLLRQASGDADVLFTVLHGHHGPT